MPNLDIHIATTADNSGAVEAQEAVAGLTREVKTGTGEHENYREKQHEILEGMHMIALMTGGELREGLHETGLGMRLLGSLTGEMSLGIVGAAAAMGAGLVTAVGMIKESYNSAQEEAKKFSEELEKSVEKAANSLGEEDIKALKKADDFAKNAIDAADALGKSYTGAAAAANAAAVSSIKDATDNVTAQSLIAEALGIQVDKYRDIVKLADLHLQAIRAEAKAKIDALNAEQKKNDEEADKTRAAMSAEAERREVLRDRLKAEQEILETLEKQNRARESEDIKRSNKTPVLDMGTDILTPQNPITAIPKIIGDAIDATIGQWKDHVEADLSQAQTKALEPIIKAQRSRVDDALKELEKSQESTDKNLPKLIEIDRKSDETSDAIATQLEETEKRVDSSTALAKAKALEASEKALADGIDEHLATMTATTPVQRAALDDLKEITSDHKVTADEIARLLRDLVTLSGGLQVGSTKTTENVQNLIGIMRTWQMDSANLAAQVAALQASAKQSSESNPFR